MFSYFFAILNPMLLSYYGLPPSMSTLLYMCLIPSYIFFAPVTAKVLQLKIMTRRAVIFTSQLFLGFFTIFSSGNLQFFTNESQPWVVVTSLIIYGACLSALQVTVFPELVEQAERVCAQKKYDQDALFNYLSGLFVFVSSVGAMLGPFLGNLLAS